VDRCQVGACRYPAGRAVAESSGREEVCEVRAMQWRGGVDEDASG
jgi:hypothetical protein